MVGLRPLVTSKNIYVGPSTVERSSLKVQEAKAYLDVVRSILYGSATYKMLVDKVKLNVIQQPNFSWFGNPDDTYPSSHFI